jgi:hypothetical protein
MESMMFDTTKDFRAGERIQLHPATDRWMMGDRYATIIHAGRKILRVRFERSNTLGRVHPLNVLEII